MERCMCTQTNKYTWTWIQSGQVSEGGAFSESRQVKIKDMLRKQIRTVMKHLDEHNFCKQTTICHIENDPVC